MTPTEILKHEHQVILRVLDAAEKEVASIKENGTIHASLVREMADFFRGFVDHCHPTKEEKPLFTRMHQQGMSLTSGPLAVMLHDHEQGRACIRAIWEALPEKGELDSITYYMHLRDVVPEGQEEWIDKIIEEERSHFVQFSELKQKYWKKRRPRPQRPRRRKGE